MSLTNTIQSPFNAITKTDNRWFNQPEQTANISNGSPNFAFGAEVTNIMINVGQYDIVFIVNGANGVIHIAGNHVDEFIDGRMISITGSDYNDRDYLVSTVTYDSGSNRTLINLNDTIQYVDRSGKVTPLKKNTIELSDMCDGITFKYDSSRGRSLKKSVTLVPDYSGIVSITTFDPTLPPSAKWTIGNFKYVPNTEAINIYINGAKYTNIYEKSNDVVEVVYYPPPPLEIVTTSIADNYFNVRNDYSPEFIDGVNFNITQSTNADNDGEYTVKSSTYDIITNVTTVYVYEDVIASPFILGEIVDIAITIDVIIFGGKLREVSENNTTGFIRVNSRIIKLVNVDYGVLGDVEITLLNPSTTKHNPIKLIDKSSKVVASDISLWDPIRDQHYAISRQIITLKAEYDPAIYQTALDDVLYDSSMSSKGIVNSAWNDHEIGNVWWNDLNLDYIPYNDDNIFPSIYDRVHYWGKKADYTNVLLYEWTESTINPNEEDWMGDGTPLYNIYNRTRTIGPVGPWSVWTKLEQVVIEQIAAMNLYNDPLWDYMTFTLLLSANTVVDVHVNGLLIESVIVGVGGLVVLTDMVTENDIVNFVIEIYQPTQVELDFDPDTIDDPLIATQYKKHTPFSIKPRMLVDKTIVNTYYFWVTDNSNKTNGNIISIRNAAANLVRNPEPFAQIGNFLPNQAGVDTSNKPITIPDRFSNITIQGLRSLVNDYDRYVIRITSDYSLRDDIRDDNTSPDKALKNKHSEWELFREQQTTNIPRALWDLVVESMLGFSLTDTAKAIPSLDRVLYDNKNNTNTRFGTNSGQAITDRDLAIKTIQLIILDPDYDITPVDKNTFLENVFDLNNEAGIRTTMDYIYNSFNTSQVNELFFSLLFDGLTLKTEMTGLFKTSWISMQSTIILDVNGRLSNG